MNRILLTGFFLFLIHLAHTQTIVRLTVDSGTATTDCTDIIGDPDPLFAVSVAGGDYVYYPEDQGCYEALPHLAFQENYPCLSLVPTTIEVCFRVTENDAFLGPPLNCDIQESCTETICDNITVPALGTSSSHSLNLSVPSSSSGEVNFTLETTGFAFPDNDLICDAVDLGTLAPATTLGDATQGTYSNLCATNIGDPNFFSLGVGISNQHGVWFRFNSGPNPGGMFIIDAISDPNGTGEEIDLEMSVFVSDNEACDGMLMSQGPYTSEDDGFDMQYRIVCPTPNTNYYIFVDGADNAGDFQGIFGLQVWDRGIAEGGDLRCDFWDLGEVPVGGSVSTPEPVSNFCATDAQDPFSPLFVSQHSVWFGFVAPPSGHVIIEGISDDIMPIGVQLGLYRSFNNTCSGFFSYVTSQFTLDALDETMEVTCLYPGRRYFILVDGSGSASRGVFELSVTDAGDITPVNNQDITLCFGESYSVGGSNYNTTGMYSDTLQVFQGCDSIVNTNLVILDELVGSVIQTQPAVGIDGTDGVATVSAVGGDGNYTYAWCTGETTATATMLVADQECCVTITDSQGCTDEVCFTVEYTTAIVPVFMDDELNCFGDSNGSISVSVSNGVPPYDYSWQNADGSLTGNGMVTTEGGSFELNNLTAGAYEITVNDAFLDTTFTAYVSQPDQLVITQESVDDASCFGICDGQLSVSVAGGIMPYSYQWSGATGQESLSSLCAGNYSLTVEDANGCVSTIDIPIAQPAEFIATASIVEEVACFQGSDGIGMVSTNGNPVAWNWDNGGDAEIEDNLSAGDYMITVTNGDGCTTTTSLTMTQPASALTVSIQELSSISCFDAQDGQLGSLVNGPYQSLSYNWSNGANTASISNLDAGNYSLVVSNERGCEANTDYNLQQPTAVQAQTFVTDVNCLDGPSSGVISIESVSGGIPGYTYGLRDGVLGDLPLIEGLEAGNYDVVVRDASGCELVLNTSVLPPPELTVDLGLNISEDDEIYLGDEITLTAIPNSNDVRFSWLHTDTLTTDEAIIRALTTQYYAVTAYDTLTHCTASDTLLITVNTDPRVYVPNAFSPNNDGNNETFFPFTGNDVVAIESFRIFDRNGALVYEKTNLDPNSISQGWDGTFNGEKMQPGVFVYFAEITFFDGRTNVIKGDVTLVR